MGWWGAGILEGDPSQNWVNKLKQFDTVEEMVETVEKAKELEHPALRHDKEVGYMVIGTLVIARGIEITKELRSRIIQAIDYEVMEGVFKQWRKPLERMVALMDLYKGIKFHEYIIQE